MKVAIQKAGISALTAASIFFLKTKNTSAGFTTGVNTNSKESAGRNQSRGRN